MDMDEARTILTNNRLTDVGSPLQLAVSAVFARVAELEAGEVTTEYAVRWPSTEFLPDGELEPREDEADARVIVGMYPAQGPAVVLREVRRGPWRAAS